MPLYPSSRSYFAPLFSLCLICAGCGQSDGIQQYTVPKVQQGLTEAAPEVPEEQDLAWFFKLMGPKEQVVAERQVMNDLLRSLQFEKDSPKFDTPAGWTLENGSGLRYQTLKREDSEPPLEIAISFLPVNDSIIPYLKANIDRWRGQLGLKPMEEEGWFEQARSQGELVTAEMGQNRILLVKLEGETEAHGETAMLSAIVFKLSADSRPEMAARPQPATPLKYETPEGWEPSQGNALRLASFKIESDTGAADVSVTRFPGGGGVLDNINRWRGQVKLEPIDEATLETATETVDVGGKQGTFALISGDEQAILVALVPDGESKWFFKMQGPVATVTGEQERFREFLNSVDFSNN